MRSLHLPLTAKALAFVCFLLLIFTQAKSNPVTLTAGCTGFRTQTQGGYGAGPNGNNPGVYVHNNFAAAFPNGLIIGCGGNTLTLTTADAVTDFLPSGTTAFGLTGVLTDPGSSYSNVLAGQLVSAVLSAGFDNYDPDFGSNSTNLQDLVITSGTFSGWTVSQLIATANSVIGGCSSAYSYSDLNDALDALNNNYDNGTSDDGFLTCSNVAPLTCSASVTHLISCHGGSNGEATATPTGGYSPYTYAWSNGQTTQIATGLITGDYAVTVTDDHGSTSNCSVTVSEPSEISVSDNDVDVSVHSGSDGSINLTITGGTGPYTFLWSDGLTTEDRPGLIAGTYTVTVTDHNGCSKAKTIVINEPTCVCTAPTQFTVDSLSASAAQVCWNAIPCATGYVLQWKNSIKSKWQVINVAAGSSCTIFTNQYSDSYDIKVATICQDGSTTAYSSVFVFHTYPSCLKPTAPYTSTIKSAQASAHWTRATDATSQVIKYRKVGTTAFTSKTLSATATSYTIKNLLANTSYEWQVKSTCTGFGKTATSDFTALQQFKTTSQKLAGESIASNLVSMKLYPNPASRDLTIAMQFENVNDQSCIIRISSMVGQIVEQKTAFVTGNSLTENLSLQNGIASGIYMVTVIVDGNAYHQQLVVSKD